LLFVKIIKPTNGIMVNVGIFVNIASPKNMPDIRIGTRVLLPLPPYLSGFEESFL
jgi:hypothetical protein